MTTTPEELDRITAQYLEGLIAEYMAGRGWIIEHIL